ncbi:MAG: hypothetical protein IIA06_08755 [Proteobacteria bacterium]|nr:hypothetical protein [Pseudomonadota bacterium]
MNDGKAKRIMTIGFNDSTNTKSCTWSDKEIPLATDYDIVILNFCTLTDKIARSQSSYLTFQNQLSRFLFSGGCLVILANDIHGVTKQSTAIGNVSISKYSFLPFSIKFINEQSEVILNAEKLPFDNYLSKLSNWNFHFSINYESYTGSPIRQIKKEKHCLVNIIYLIEVG